MKLRVYSIYDSVAQVFNRPFTEINDGTAIRSFNQNAASQPHKNDYTLFRLGEFVDHSGMLIPEKAPVKVITGFEVEAQPELPNMLREQA